MFIDICRILIIDDSDEQRFIIRSLLEEIPNIKIDECNSGIKGLEKLSETQYAVVLLDIEMPGLLGFDVARAVKFTELNANTPIIMITAHNEDQEDINYAYECGATDYIRKPINPLILRSKVSQFVTLHSTQQHAIYLQQENALILNAASHGVIKLDLNGKIVYANKMAEQLVNRFGKLLNSHFFDWFQASFNIEQENLFEYLLQLFDAQDTCNISNINLLAFNKEPIPVELSCSSVINHGSLEIIIFFQNISERLNAERKLIKLANFDHLTQLGNRANFQTALKRAYANSSRYNTSFALVMIDLDKFKNINDTLGHDVGDEVLVEFSARLQSNIRESDSIVRLGGDEFAVILESISNEYQTTEKVIELQQKISTPFIVRGKPLPIESSVGIAYCKRGDPDTNTLQKWADLALYAAKHAGRNRVKTYAPSMSEELEARTSIQTRLQEGIKNKELQVYFQPQISSMSRQVVGLEALVRWPNFKNGQALSPEVFIPIAEEAGMVQAICLFVLEESCKLLESWKEDKQKSRLKVSVNLSAAQLNQQEDIEQLLNVIKMYSFKRSQLSFEITETSLIENAELVNIHLKNIHDFGCKLSLDDFGTGYSSLTHVQYSPIYEIKIDKSFVQDIHQQRTQMLVKAIIGLAKTFKLSIIAEGIETTQQLNTLIRLGCHQFQGYYFSKAVPKDEINKVLEAINFREKLTSSNDNIRKPLTSKSAPRHQEDSKAQALTPATQKEKRQH